MAATGQKAPGAFRTIGELSQELGVAQHILRYWETKFPQLRPLQRAGNRRYYRAGDVELARTINRLLNSEGYTVRGVQKLLRSKDGSAGGEDASPPAPAAEPPQPASAGARAGSVDLARLNAVRDRLASALGD